MAGLVLGVVASGAARAFELEELMQGMASATGVVAEFEESKEISLLTAPLESRGRLYFVPPDRLARFTLAPGFSSLVVDGETLRFREGERGAQTDLSGNPMARVFVDNFIVLWSGDLERLLELYTPELSGGLPSWQLSLAPRQAPLDRFVEKIVLAGEGKAMVRMEMVEKDGDRTITVFGSVVTERVFAPAELELLFGEGRPLPDAPQGQ